MSTAHRATQRRTLADPDSMKAPSTNPTLKNHPRLTNPPNPNPDPTPIIKPSIFGLKTHSLSKSLNSSQAHKFRAPQKPTSLKAMSVSAMVEKSREEEEEEKRSDHKLAVSLKGFEEELKRKKKERHLASPVPSAVSGGGRRRSFGGTHIELSDVFASNGVKVVSVDMPPVMQIHAVELARRVHDSLEKFTSKTLASTLKKEFDGIYGPAWHCIVGTSFGSFVTHSVGGFLYFSMDQKLYILLFKTTVQRAD